MPRSPVIAKKRDDVRSTIAHEEGPVSTRPAWNHALPSDFPIQARTPQEMLMNALALQHVGQLGIFHAYPHDPLLHVQHPPTPHCVEVLQSAPQLLP